MLSETTKIAIFKGQKIRKTIHKNEWWFSVVDAVQALTDSNIPRRYWSDLKIKLKKEGFVEVYEKIVQLKLEASDGKLRKTDCANTETMFRMIQTIPSPKAEPFKSPLPIRPRAGVAAPSPALPSPVIPLPIPPSPLLIDLPRDISIDRSGIKFISR